MDRRACATATPRSSVPLRSSGRYATVASSEPERRRPNAGSKPEPKFCAASLKLVAISKPADLTAPFEKDVLGYVFSLRPDAQRLAKPGQPRKQARIAFIELLSRDRAPSLAPVPLGDNERSFACVRPTDAACRVPVDCLWGQRAGLGQGEGRQDGGGVWLRLAAVTPRPDRGRMGRGLLPQTAQRERGQFLVPERMERRRPSSQLRRTRTSSR